MVLDKDTSKYLVKTSPKRVIFQLMLVFPGSNVPVRFLIHGAGILGISENNLRVSLARLKSEKMVQTHRRGEYKLGSAAVTEQRAFSSWRDREEHTISQWDGSWLGIYLLPTLRSDRKASKLASETFFSLGAELLEPGLALRPNNLKEGLQIARQKISELGLSKHMHTFEIRHLAPQTEEKARSLWSTSSLNDVYEDLQVQMLECEKGLEKLTVEEAAKEIFELGSIVIQTLIYDPLLPPPFVDIEKRKELTEAMAHFYELGHIYWLQAIQNSLKEN